jgi:hypothetical protein
MMWTQIDSCLAWPNGKAYMFSGDEYLRYDIATDKVDPGYPAKIAGRWPGLWSPAGAGVVWPNGKAYFFRGHEYVRYDIASDKVDPGYPAPIAGRWPGLSLSRVDAAVVWPNGKAYLFGVYPTGGTEPNFGQYGYVRYDIAGDRQDDGYPTHLEPNWKGLAAPVINACAVWPNGKAYFFFGGEYFRYDISGDRVDPGYPAQIAGNWPGVPIAPPTPPRPPS